MRLSQCHNFHDFRKLAQKRLPGPIFNYIDGGADDETTLRRNTSAFRECDLIPRVLTGVKDIVLHLGVVVSQIIIYNLITNFKGKSF